MDVEFTVLSDRREGLLRELGTVITRNGFSLLRQRIVKTEKGVKLWLRIDGPDDRLLELEEIFSSHPRVFSFASNHQVSDDDTIKDSPTADKKQPEPAIRLPGKAAKEVVEAELPAMAREYPAIFPRLLNLLPKLPLEQRAASLLLAGKRVGAWVYKRDYALGGKLDLHDTLATIVLPALDDLLVTELHGQAFHVFDNPLCNRQSNGDFLCGFIQGLLQESGITQKIEISEDVCRCSGAGSCVFDVKVPEGKY